MSEHNMRKKIAQLEQQLNALQKETAATKERLEKTENNRDEYKTKYFQFKTIFQRQTHTFYQYQSLSRQSQEALSGIFKGESFEEFLACGVQPGNIDTLWEFARSQALDGTLEDVRLLERRNRRSSVSKTYRQATPLTWISISVHRPARRQAGSQTSS